MGALLVRTPVTAKQIVDSRSKRDFGSLPPPLRIPKYLITPARLFWVLRFFRMKSLVPYRYL